MEKCDYFFILFFNNQQLKMNLLFEIDLQFLKVMQLLIMLQKNKKWYAFFIYFIFTFLFFLIFLSFSKNIA